MIVAESMEDEISPQGLVLVPRGAEDNSVVAGPHIRGRRLRTSSATGGEEVDLLLPGTARYDPLYLNKFCFACISLWILLNSNNCAYKFK